MVVNFGEKDARDHFLLPICYRKNITPLIYNDLWVL